MNPRELAQQIYISLIGHELPRDYKTLAEYSIVYALTFTEVWNQSEEERINNAVVKLKLAESENKSICYMRIPGTENHCVLTPNHTGPCSNETDNTNV